MKRVTSRNLKTVMERLTEYALKTEDEARQAFCHDLDLFLNELAEQDTFGTEGSMRPQEETRDNEETQKAGNQAGPLPKM